MTDGIAGKDFSILFQRDLLFVRKFFAHQLAAAFDDLGYETTVCEFTSQDDLDAVLSLRFGKNIVQYLILIPCCHGLRWMTEHR